MRSALKMSNALHVLRPDCAWCFWCVDALVNVTSTDQLFSLGKFVIFSMFSTISKPVYLSFVTNIRKTILCFCCVCINLHLFCSGNVTNQSTCSELNLMLFQCTRPCRSWALDTSIFSEHALDLSHSTRKSK